MTENHYQRQPVLPLLTIGFCLTTCTGCFNKINERNQALGNEIIAYLKANRGAMSNEELVAEVNRKFKLYEDNSVEVYETWSWPDDESEEADEDPLPDICISIY